MKELQAIVRALLADESEATVLATLVSVEGSSYRRPGARLIVRSDGSRVGSISGGCLEEDVIARAHEVSRTGTSDAVIYDTTSENDLVWGVGLGCHGIVRVFLERLPRRPVWVQALADNFAARRPTPLVVVHAGGGAGPLGTRLATGNEPRDPANIFLDTVAPPTALAIFGAGDDAQPLARMAKELGWQVTVADPRPAFASAARFPSADRLVSASADELVARLAPGPDALAVVMTHHYVHDVPILRELLSRPLAYVGLLGPRKRAEKILTDLETQGANVTREVRQRLHAPVGLDLGADAPEQVALAILAEMQATLAGRNAKPLRERTRPIHEVSVAL